MRKLSIPQGLFIPNGEITTVILDEHNVALIDTVDLPFIVSYNWYCAVRNKKKYAITSIKGSYGKKIYMHRLLMGTERTEEIDHIDHNGLNNRRYNLRTVTHKQNLENRSGSNSNSTSGFRGVTLFVDQNGYKHWSAQAMSNGAHYGKTFPHTEDGLRSAIEYSIELRQKLFTHSTN